MGWAGPYARERTPSRVSRQRPIHPDRAVDGNRVTCTRARACEQANACANDSSSCEDHGDMRRVQGRARIEARHTWLFEQSLRSEAGKDDLKVVVRSFMPSNTCERAC